MANTNKPTGFTPVKYLNGADWTGQVNFYYIAPADTNAYYIGDPVALTGTGDARGIPGITIATASNPILGIVVAVGTVPGGPYINPNDLTKVNRPSGAQTPAYYAAVVDDPQVLLEAQEGGAGPVLTATSVTKNVNLLAAAPATGVAVSGYTFNDATVATTAAFNFQLLGLVQRYDQGALNTYGAFSKWLLRMNSHHFKAGTPGV